LYERARNKSATNSHAQFVQIEFDSEQSSSNTKRLVDFLRVDEQLLIDEKVSHSSPTADLKSIENRICKNYAMYGYCQNREEIGCTKSHEINLILALEWCKMEKSKRKRQKKELDEARQNYKSVLEQDNHSSNLNEQNQAKALVSSQKFRLPQNQLHLAGVDAFMTGYVFLSHLNHLGKLLVSESNRQIVESLDNSEPLSLNYFQLDEYLFNVFLTGKDYPLLVCKSSFAKTSQNHQEKVKRKDIKQAVT
jgi:hypothetical protein